MEVENGSLLRNGCTVLRIKRINPDFRIILAMKPNPEGQYHPYVTWAMDEDGNTFLGNYFKTHTDALLDFEQRT